NATDSQLLMLRDLYRNNPSTGELAHWINNAQFKNDLTAQFALAGPDGNMIYSSVGPITQPINIADRPHFKFHIDTPKDDLYISVPILGRVSGKHTINLTRRLLAPDGEFVGIIIASLDLPKLERFYNSIDVNKGIISLVGFDGIIRVRSSRDVDPSRFIGQSVRNTQVFDMYEHQRSGNYWNLGSAAAQFGGVQRLISYRVLDGLPLIAVVGQAEGDIFQKTEAESVQYYRVTGILTAFVMIIMGF